MIGVAWFIGGVPSLWWSPVLSRTWPFQARSRGSGGWLLMGLPPPEAVPFSWDRGADRISRILWEATGGEVDQNPTAGLVSLCLGKRVRGHAGVLIRGGIPKPSRGDVGGIGSHTMCGPMSPVFQARLGPAGWPSNSPASFPPRWGESR